MQPRLLHTAWLILFITCYTALPAQQFNPYFNFRHLNVESGLAQDVVYHFLQDSRGYMWLGTRNGLTVYDGIRAVNFQHDDQNKKSITGNFITRILEDSNDLVWIGNNAGIDLFNRNNNSFTHFGIPATNGNTEDTYCVLLGFSDRYNLWFIDTKSQSIKVFNTKEKQFRFVTKTDAVDGMMYVNPVSRTVHIWSYLSNGTTHYEFQQDSLIIRQRFFYGGNDSNTSSLQIFHVFPQNDSTAWLSTAKGLIELNPANGKYRIYNQMGKEPVTEIRYVARSPRGLLWISTGGFGVYTFDTRTKKFMDHFRNYVLDPFSICSNNIVSLYFDRVGNIWCGSYGRGVSYANIESRLFSKHLSRVELDHWKRENNVIWLEKDPDEHIWCILQDVPGFCLLDSALNVKEFRHPLLTNGKIFDGSVYQILFDGKYNAWCTTDRGLYRYNVLSNRMVKMEYPRLSEELFGSNWTSAIIHLHDSSLLFSTMSGLYRISTKNGKQTIKPFSDLNDKPFKSFDIIFEDKEKNIYVKDIDENFYVLSSSGTGDNYLLKKHFRLPMNIFQITEYQEEIYLATSRGLYLLHKKTMTIEKSSVNNNLPFAVVNNILISGNKWWLFGDKGLYYYNPADQKGRLFTTEDGLPSNKFSDFCIVVTGSGKCITGTTNGLVSFYPDRLQDIVYPPRPQLINMYVNDSANGFLTNAQESSRVLLDHGQNTFSFEFSGISFQHVAANTYEYKLEGYDENWIKSGTARYTRYSKIPPGKYRFSLRMLDANGTVSPFMKFLDIEIKKAFWQTAFSRMIMAAMLVLVIWLLIKWYLSIRIRKQQRAFERQQAIEKERTRIASDMHDDLGAGLSSIRFLSEKVRRNTFSEITKNDIDKILSSSTELMDKMNEIVWAMNEKNDSLGDMLFYIRSYTKEYCEEAGLQCIIEVPEYIPDVFVSGEIRRNIFLTIKESLHNIIKHAEADRVVIDMRVSGVLYLTIRDNGIGFGLEGIIRDSMGNGLRNMRKRIESIGGSFKIFEDHGVVIDIRMPLPQ